MKKMVYYILCVLIPVGAFGGLLDSAAGFAENAKRLSQCMQEENENYNKVLDGALHFTGDIVRNLFGIHDQAKRVETLFTEYSRKMEAEDFSRMMVRVLEKAFSERPSDDNWSKFKRQMRMTFMPHEDHLAYVIKKANQILQSSGAVAFEKNVKDIADVYLRENME